MTQLNDLSVNWTALCMWFSLDSVSSPLAPYGSLAIINCWPMVVGQWMDGWMDGVSFFGWHTNDGRPTRFRLAPGRTDSAQHLHSARLRMSEAIRKHKQKTEKAAFSMNDVINVNRTWCEMGEKRRKTRFIALFVVVVSHILCLFVVCLSVFGVFRRANWMFCCWLLVWHINIYVRGYLICLRVKLCV